MSLVLMDRTFDHINLFLFVAAAVCILNHVSCKATEKEKTDTSTKLYSLVLCFPLLSSPKNSHTPPYQTRSLPSVSMEKSKHNYRMQLFKYCDIWSLAGTKSACKVWNNTLISGGSGTALQRAGLHERRGYETSTSLMRTCLLKLCWEYKPHENATVLLSLLSFSETQDTHVIKIKSKVHRVSPREQMIQNWDGYNLQNMMPSFLKWSLAWM